MNKTTARRHLIRIIRALEYLEFSSISLDNAKFLLKEIELRANPK